MATGNRHGSGGTRKAVVRLAGRAHELPSNHGEQFIEGAEVELWMAPLQYRALWPGRETLQDPRSETASRPRQPSEPKKNRLRRKWTCTRIIGNSGGIAPVLRRGQSSGEPQDVGECAARGSS